MHFAEAEHADDGGRPGRDLNPPIDRAIAGKAETARNEKGEQINLRPLLDANGRDREEGDGRAPSHLPEEETAERRNKRKEEGDALRIGAVEQIAASEPADDLPSGKGGNAKGSRAGCNPFFQHHRDHLAQYAGAGEIDAQHAQDQKPEAGRAEHGGVCDVRLVVREQSHGRALQQK